jgi:hypothetical protein
LLLRWRSFLGTLRLENDDKSFSILTPRARFDAYQPGRTALATSAPTIPDPGDSGGAPGTDIIIPSRATPAQSSSTQAPVEDRAEGNPFLDNSL